MLKIFSVIGLLESLIGSSVVIFGCTFGSLILYQSIKRQVKFLFIAGLLIIFAGLMYLGQLSDFLCILITGKNLNPPYWYAILCYMWVAPGAIIALYLGAELILPKKKKIIIIIYTILGITFELFLWLDTINSFTFNLPKTPGETIIDVNFNRLHPTFILIVIILVSVLIFLVIGFFYKGYQSTGIIKKKFYLLSLGFGLFVLTGALDSLSSPGNILFLVRIGMFSSSWFWYLGLKEEKAKPEKFTKKEIKSLNGSVPKLIETLSLSKPAKISEEEVTFYREQNICLVCKGKVEGFSFICGKCKALYCENCARSLIEIENVCWVCSTPIDKTKPIKAIKEEKIIYLGEESKKKKP